MSDNVISVKSLSKRYFVGHQSAGSERYQTLRDIMVRNARSLARKTLDMAHGRQIIQGDEVEEFWALKDVSFDVERGEVLGIIGRNGAGKSTLLKVLSRITELTEGRIELDGRVASLLEAGTGFHPELSGRENIFLNGAILGMKRAEIKAKFDEIVDFAEVDKFVDTPVKRYSSGMHVRLAFAVAAHLETDILIIDEVLAVGDVVFQKKCLGKMKAVAKSGRTVLFVSHNMQIVTGLTDRAILLQDGRASMIGDPSQVVDAYLAEDRNDATNYHHRWDGENPEIVGVSLFTSNPNNIHQFGQPLTVEIDVVTPFSIPNAAISFQILSNSNQSVVHALNLDSEVAMLRSPGVHQMKCMIPRTRLYPGHYSLSFDFGASEPRRVFNGPKDICSFEIVQLDEIREFYWYPNNAIYVEDVEWNCRFLGKICDLDRFK